MVVVHFAVYRRGCTSVELGTMLVMGCCSGVVSPLFHCVFGCVAKCHFLAFEKFEKLLQPF